MLTPSSPLFHVRRSALSGPVLSVIIPLLGLGWTAGCGDESNTPTDAGGSANGGSGAKGGKGGSSGKGGASGKSGSSSTGGSGAKGGTGVTGGTTGEAGDDSGGTSAKGGKVGKGGSGNAGDDTGATGGTGLATGGTSANAGESGAAGSEPRAGTDSGGSAGDGAGGEAGSDGPGAAGNGGEAGGGPVLPLTIQRVFPLSPTGPDRLFGVTYGPDGSVFAVGQIAISNDSNADQALLLVKFTPAGDLDPTFGASGVVVRNVASGTNGEIYRGVTVQTTGKVVVVGNAEHPGATDARDRDMVVLRFNTDGTKDTTWGTDGVVTLDLSTGVVNGTGFSADSAWGIDRYADDRIVISGGQVRSGGTDTDFALVRLNADGTRDASFGVDGLVTLDTQLNGTSSDNASPRNVTILPGTDGVIGAGYRPLAGHDTAPVLWKVTDAGVVDTTFGVNGVFSDAVLAEQTESYQAAVQSVDGGGYKLVTTGYGKGVAGETTDLVSLRVSSAGVLDTTYGTNGLVRVDIGGFGDNSRRLLVLPDRRIVLVGGGRLTSADVDGIVMMLTPDGQPDSSFEFNGWRRFELGGVSDFLWSAALAPDRKTLAIAGIKGVGSSPTPPSANDDAALVLLPLP